MQHLSALVALLLVAFVSAAPSQPSEQSASASQSSSSVPVVGNSAAPVGVSGSVEAAQPPVPVEQPSPVHQVQPQVVGASYYAPAAGIIQVVGGEQQQQQHPKPVVGSPVVRSVEQYGQPESASLPPNYKPFGSWGLYIGGNPADGYYTNYYKALSNSVDQQQAGEAVKPTAALSPILRQAGSSPYVGGDYYPFAYSPADLNSGARVAVEPAHSPVSPVQVGAQVYGAPASFESNYHYANQVSPYADAYATKKVGSAYSQQKEVSAVKEAAPAVQAPIPAPPAKGFQSRVYVYPPVGPLSAPLPMHSSQVHQHSHQSHHTHPQQAQVVAYPVPVGSQIVGSQQGVEGAFNPYGIHAFTRYAVKPTVVNSDPSYYYGVQGGQQMPAYKQQTGYSAGYYPLGFYGYPLNQLHYSQGSIAPQGNSDFHQYNHHAHAAPAYPFETSMEKPVESENKPQN